MDEEFSILKNKYLEIGKLINDDENTLLKLLEELVECKNHDDSKFIEMKKQYIDLSQRVSKLEEDMRIIREEMMELQNKNKTEK